MEGQIEMLELGFAISVISVALSINSGTSPAGGMGNCVSGVVSPTEHHSRICEFSENTNVGEGYAKRRNGRTGWVFNNGN